MKIAAIFCTYKRPQLLAQAIESFLRQDYRRPQYTREVLDALAQCDGIGAWTLLPNVEPGNAEVIAAFRDFHACECRLVVNERRLGLNRNTLAVLMRAFHLKADHIGENSRTAEWYRANHRTPWVAMEEASLPFSVAGTDGSQPDKLLAE